MIKKIFTAVSVLAILSAFLGGLTAQAQNRAVSGKVFDISGQPVNNKVSGVSEERYEYDEAGRLTGVQKVDSQGNLVVSD